jgi:hypothetical protein
MGPDVFVPRQPDPPPALFPGHDGPLPRGARDVSVQILEMADLEGVDVVSFCDSLKQGGVGLGANTLPLQMKFEAAIKGLFGVCGGETIALTALLVVLQQNHRHWSAIHRALAEGSSGKLKDSIERLLTGDPPALSYTQRRRGEPRARWRGRGVK